MPKAYVFDAIRTPRGAAKSSGGLHSLAPTEILGQLFQALEHRGGFSPTDVEDVIIGCVTQFGEQGGNIARPALIRSGWPEHIPATTLSRFCSSSLDATCWAFDSISAGSKECIVAGGVESMSRVRMLSDQATWMVDPAVALQTRAVPLGSSADLIATQEGYSRHQLDSYALQSQQRASIARANGYFAQSIIPMSAGAEAKFTEDEVIRSETTIDSLARLEPAFAEIGAQGVDEFLKNKYTDLHYIEHQHTAGNSPAMADAGSLVLVANQEFGGKSNLSPRAVVLGHRQFCGPVEQGLSGGIVAAQKLLKEHRLAASDLDLVEFNESFAGPTLKFIADMQLDGDIVNPNGGGIALGHPMGATGGILIGTLLDELERQNKELGMVAICGATGSGSAMLLRRV